MHPYQDHSLSIILTTHCNMRCPECTMRIFGISRPVHYLRAEIEHIGSMMHGLRQVALAGGEPTLHPEFRELVPRLKQILGCQQLIMATNGAGIRAHEDLLHYFDGILITHYSHNAAEVEIVRRHTKDLCPTPGLLRHHSLHRRAVIPRPCDGGTGRIKWAYHRVYPCCAIPSGMEHIGIPLTKDWPQVLPAVPQPCSECFLAVDASDGSLPRDLIRENVERHVEMWQRYRKEDPHWPDPVDDILLFGADVDGWIRREALIIAFPPPTGRTLYIELESHAPPTIHPIRLRFEDASGARLAEVKLKKAGPTTVQLPLRKLTSGSLGAWITVHCDRTFIPQQLDPQNPDARELGILIAHLRYG